MQHSIFSGALSALVLVLAPVALAPVARAGSPPSQAELVPAPSDPAPVEPGSIELAHPEEVLFDASEDGSRWAVGLKYKLAARPGGVAYAPFRGSDAPRSEILEWRPTSLSIGAKALAFHAEGAVSRADSTLRTDRGSLVELLRCGTDEVEFVAEVQVPAGASGALVLDYALGSEYAVAPDPAGGLVFHGELGDVFMGAAVAVEPGGTRTPVTLDPIDRGFRFVVPADVVARSGGRVVIDPFITSDTLTSLTGAFDESVDVAAYNNQFRIAVERTFSGTDHDVLVYRVGTFPGLSASFTGTFSGTFEDWRDPSIAVRASRGDMLVAARSVTATGPEIRCIWSDAVTGNRGFPFTIMEGFDPDICVETTSNGLSPRWAVVCVGSDASSTTPLLRRMVGGNGASAGPIGPIFSWNPGTDVRLVSIGETTGPDSTTGLTEFRAAYYEVGPGIRNLRLLRFNRDGQNLGISQLQSIAGTVRHLSLCSLGEANLGPAFRTCAVAYEESDSVTGLADVKVVASDGVGPRGEPVSMGELMNVNRGLARRRPSIASDGVRWTVSFEEDADFTLPKRIVVVEGSYAGGRFGLTGRRITQSNFFGDYFAPSTIAKWVGDSDLSEDSKCLTAYLGGGGTRAALTEPIPERAAGVQECEAEPNSASSAGAWLSVLGAADVVSDKVVRLQDAPPNQFCLLLTASAPNFVPGVSGSDGNLCLGLPGFGRFNADLGAISTAGTRDVTFRPTAIPQALGTTSAAVGDSWWVQAWFRDTHAGGPTSNFSKAVRIRFYH
ncbi:MAG: hypothetical protein AAFP86_01890 [Planctomycetota bacterium]